MTDQQTQLARFAEAYLNDHPEMLEVYVQGPNGKDVFRPGTTSVSFVSSEYGTVDLAYVVKLKDGSIKAYGQASAVSGEYGKYEVKFEAGVLQIFGFNGNLIEAFAPGTWAAISGSESN